MEKAIGRGCILLACKIRQCKNHGSFYSNGKCDGGRLRVSQRGSSLT